MTMAGTGWSPVVGPFHILQSNQIREAPLQGLPDCGQEGLKSVHGPQPGIKSACLLPDTRVGMTPPGSFGVWCLGQTQSQTGL